MSMHNGYMEEKFPFIGYTPQLPMHVAYIPTCTQSCIIYAELGLITQVQPVMIEVLDVAPYNTFSILCTAVLPTNVTTAKEFVWRSGISNITAGAGTTITDLNLNSSTSTSILSTTVSNPGAFAYICDVTASSARSSATATVTVNGMSMM